MSNPGKEIEDFLCDNGINPNVSIDVALQFAVAMCEELRASLAQWEEAEAALREIKSDAASGVTN